MAEEEKVIEVEVRTMDLQGEGFLDRLEEVAGFYELFNEMERNLSVARVRNAKQFLMDHIIKPASLEEKKALLSSLDPDGLIDLLEKITGGNTAVPPQNGEDSGDSSA